MNIDKGLIRHWAMLFESENAKREGKATLLENVSETKFGSEINEDGDEP